MSEGQPEARTATEPTSWAAARLTEFLASVSAANNEASAIQEAIERAGEALEAEVGAIVGKRKVVGATGRIESASEADLVAVAEGRSASLELPGLGRCAVLTTPVDDENLEAIVLARAGRSFSSEERSLCSAMARALALTVRLLRVVEAERGLRELSERQSEENARLVESLDERRRLLERLSKIQRSIVSRRDLDEVLDAIVAGAKDLLGDETVGLRLIAPDQPSELIMVASAGVKPELARAEHRSPVGVGAGGLAVAEGKLTVIEDYEHHDQALPGFAADGIRSALAVPVLEHDEVVGSLVVATHRTGRKYSQAEREMLEAFAEHASLALTDARTVEDAIHQAFHDSLTGLPNRLLLADRLERALTRASRAGHRVAVLFVDLDAFKRVNDSLGHSAGDQLLREAARRLTGCIRTADTAARFGGDEFVVLLEDVEDVEEARVAEVANRILETFEEPFQVHGREVYIGASIGIAIGSEETDDLIRNADLALYGAKARGKGRKQAFEPRMHTAVVERLELEGGLGRALREGELALEYQPIVELRTGHLFGVEALVRWHHPTRGLLLPGEFIPIAEDSRLMLPLGRWVLSEACRQAGTWRGQRGAEVEFTVSVNLSSAQFRDPRLVDNVSGALERADLPPSRLIIELTETALLTEPEVVEERMRALKRLGVRLAIDNFGTGSASLRHVAQFPIDVLKVDRSFVDRIGVAPRQAAIARSIIDLGRELEMIVIAEGIETEEQLHRLLVLGCRYGQGFHLARPEAPGQIKFATLAPAAAAAPAARRIR